MGYPVPGVIEEYISLLKARGIITNMSRFVTTDRDFWHVRANWKGEEVLFSIYVDEIDGPDSFREALQQALYEHWHLNSNTDLSLEEWVQQEKELHARNQ